MAPLIRQRLGTLLVLLGVAIVVGSFAVSAATAPDAGAGVANDAGDRGRTLVGMQAEGRVAMLDAEGDTVWRLDSEDVDYFDVTMLDNGSVLAGFIAEGRRSCGEYASPCSRTGFRLIDPQPEPRVVGEWSFPVRTKVNSEVHDVEQLPSGEYLLTDMDRERILTVAPNGTVTWQWNASARYDAPPDPTRTDWLHINDVDRLGDGRYMVSIRNANQLVVVERGAGVIEVINRDRERADNANCKRNDGLADYDGDDGGDVLCGDPGVMDHQHNPQSIDDGAVLVADSENDRIVELHEDGGEWSVAWMVHTSNGVRYDWPRDADRLPNGNTLITDTRNNRLVEVTPNGTTVWHATTGLWPYEAERLPYGELAGDDRLSRMNATGDAPIRGNESALPFVDRAYAGLSFVVSLPTWFQPWHIGAVAVAVVLVLAGGVLIVSERWDR